MFQTLKLLLWKRVSLHFQTKPPFLNFLFTISKKKKTKKWTIIQESF